MLSIAFALAAASVAEQMAPAKQGMLQCQAPDLAFKTCVSLSRVWQVGPDRFRFESELLIDPDGPVVVTERNTTTVQGNKVCETVRLAEIDSWSVKVAGVPASPSQTTRYRAALKRKFAPFSGKVICTSIAPGEQGMNTVEATIGGKRVPAFDYAMEWVGPNDGWTVAP